MAEITVASIREKVRTDPRWAERAILALYACQTADERSSEETRYLNGVGFNAIDANILSSFAQQLQAGRHLTERQLSVAFRCLPKYSAQLYAIAQSKVKAVA